MFSSVNLKDSARNIRETGEFTCSLAAWDTRFEMNLSSAPVPADVDEYPIGGLTAVKSKFVTPPRVKQSPAAFECRHWRTIELPDVDRDCETGHYVVIGQVVAINIDDRFIGDGRVDTGAMRPLARLGYMDYAVVTLETIFTLNRPEVASDGSVANQEMKTWDGAYR
jgi:flavin reductase (DIM6/NTAB) family NADH-FMN oxidoreductase RutF